MEVSTLDPERLEDQRRVGVPQSPGSPTTMGVPQLDPERLEDQRIVGVLQSPGSLTMRVVPQLDPVRLRRGRIPQRTGGPTKMIIVICIPANNNKWRDDLTSCSTSCQNSDLRFLP